MKSSILGLALVALSQLSLAAPSGLVKRNPNSTSASASDTCNIGYCTLSDGTTGGIGGKTITVTTLDALRAAVAGDEKAIVIISGAITGNTEVRIGSNKSVLGKNRKAELVGVGLRVLQESNVIIRNLKISKVLASAGDAIGIQSSHNVWIDHLDLSTDRDHGKDYYDSLLDITHGSDYITVSFCHFHDHCKTSLVGGTEGNGPEDRGHLTVTYWGNYWHDIETRGPSFRYGEGHIANNYFLSIVDAINTRDGAQVLVENNVFEETKKALYSVVDGYAVERGNSFGDARNFAPEGTIKKMPYNYSLIPTSDTKAYVLANSGNILSFSGN